MNLPPLLTGLALLFWGHQTGIWYPALVLAVVLESARVVRWRLDLSDTDYSRFWDLCNILFAAAAFYCFINREGNNTLMNFFQTTAFSPPTDAPAAQVFFIFFQWWPLIFFPMAVAQAYGLRDQIPASVFVWLLRGRTPAAAPGAPAAPPELAVNVGYLYLGICLLAAGVANRRDPWFYTGFCLITGLALWATQPRRVKTVLWFVLLLLVAKLGYWGHVGLNTSQAAIENAVSTWVSRYAGRTLDSSESHTSIGRFGRLKLSNRIIMTVEGDGPLPSLLRDSSYTTFKTPTWTVTNRTFTAITQDIDIATWNLLPFKAPNPALTLTGLLTFATETPLPLRAHDSTVTLTNLLSLATGKISTHQLPTNIVTLASFFSRLGGLLPIPHGAVQIENLPDANLTTNRYGAVRSASGTDFFRCRVHYGKGRTIDSPPEDADRVVPEFERKAITNVVEQLRLHGLTELQTVNAITALFSRDYSYTLYQSKANWRRPAPAPNRTPLAVFLEETRAGHCEHFATATVLLLRQAGIPARYTTGFSVQEPERSQPGRFIVRESHAHAWCLYYSYADRAWHELDTTPDNWIDAERNNASTLTPLNDFFTRAWFRFNRWRHSDTKSNWQTYALWIAAGLTAILLFRVLRNKRRARRPDDTTAADEHLLWPGADSDFYRIEQHLLALGLARSPGETPATWLHRIAKTPALAYTQLQPILELHYRYRFDPRGLSPAERAQLRRAVQAYLERQVEVSN